MQTIVARWDRGWLMPRSEAFLFRQVCEAYDADRLIFVGPIQEGIARVEQYSELSEALATCDGERIFLEPTGQKTLADIPIEPADVVLIFGSTTKDNLAESDPWERYRFLTARPRHHGIFGVTAVGIVLAHRHGQ